MKIHNSKIVFDQYIQIEIKDIENDQGQIYPFSIVNLPSDAVIILAKDEEGFFILNQELRMACNQRLLGCPGGLIEKGESPVEAGMRELLEETGYLASDMQILGSVYPFPGICSQKIYYLYAPHAKKVQNPKLDPLENIHVKLLTHEDLTKYIQEGNPTDGILVANLWFYENFISRKTHVSF